MAIRKTASGGQITGIEPPVPPQQDQIRKSAAARDQEWTPQDETELAKESGAQPGL